MMNIIIKPMSTEPEKKIIDKQLKGKKDAFIRTPAADKTLIKKAQTYPADKVNVKQKKEDPIDDDMEMAIKNLKKEKKNKKVKCSHTSIINEGGIDICVDCGETINSDSFDTEWRYYGDADSNKSYDPSRCQYRKVQDKGIKKDLEKLGFSREIIDKSDYYYQKVTQGDIKRSNLRKGIMFACVLYSYKYIKKHITSEELDKVFEIGRKKMSKGLTYFKTRISKEELNELDFEYITAEHYIPSILEKFHVKEEHVKYVLKLYKHLSDKSTLINTSNPQSVSSGLVYYFLKKLNLEITPLQFGKIVGLSEITISRIANEIEEIILNE